MVNARKITLILTISLLLFARPAKALEWYLYGIGGYGSYNYRADEYQGPALGLMGGIQASDPLSFEVTVQYDEVGEDQYYFALAGARYRFLKADFFMIPSADFHAGILVPVGDKEDIDGVAGIGIEFAYQTRYNIEFGPRIESTVVFAGPYKGFLFSWTAFVGYRF